jgi:hypothetical protein
MTTSTFFLLFFSNTHTSILINIGTPMSTIRDIGGTSWWHPSFEHHKLSPSVSGRWILTIENDSEWKQWYQVEKTAVAESFDALANFKRWLPGASR